MPVWPAYLVFLVMVGFIVAWLFAFRETDKDKDKEGFEPMTTYELPRIVWVYWDSLTEMPVSIQNVTKNNKRTIRRWEIRFLDKNTMRDYVPVDAMPDMSKLQPAQKADWLRLYLLETYGGCWIDAGVIVNHEEGLEKFRDECIEHNAQFGGFYFLSRVVDSNALTFVENYFIMAPKQSPLIKEWRKEFEKAISVGFLKYKEDMLADGFKLHKIFEADSKNDTYLTMHACFLRLAKRHRRIPMLLYKAEDSVFKVQDECGWDRKCIHKRLDGDPTVKDIPFIKLVTNDRTGYDLIHYNTL